MSWPHVTRGEVDISIEAGTAVDERHPEQVAERAPSPRGDRRRVPTALLVLLGLVAGIVGAVVVPRLLDDRGDTATEAPTPGTGAVDRPSVTTPADPDIPAGARAESPEAAVRGFLDAEVAKDFETSFGFLSAADRAAHGSPAGWVAAHADAIPPVLGYELEPVTPGLGEASAVAMVRFEPGLDQVVGLTPGRARVTWDVRQDADGTWGVSLGESTTFEPLYPSADEAGPAARRWADARRACDTPENEYATLVGTRGLAEALCGASGDVSTGEPAPLGDIEAARFATAFGPETAVAARVVRLRGAVELGAVLAPIGDVWTVIGVVP